MQDPWRAKAIETMQAHGEAAASRTGRTIAQALVGQHGVMAGLRASLPPWRSKGAARADRPGGPIGTQHQTSR